MVKLGHEDVWGSGDIAASFLTSVLDGGGGQFQDSAPLPAGKEPPVPSG
jgi:hypothetical protein